MSGENNKKNEEQRMKKKVNFNVSIANINALIRISVHEAFYGTNEKNAGSASFVQKHGRP